MGIESIVKSDVFMMFREGKFEEASKILRKLSFKLTEDNTTEEQRIVLYNLAWCLNELGEYELAKEYITRIKYIMDKDIQYTKDNPDMYNIMLILYSSLFYREIEIEENIKINKINYEYYCNKPDFLNRALACKCNIYMYEKNYEEAINVIDSIHSYIINDLFEDLEKDYDMKCKLKTLQNELLECIKEKCPSAYNNYIEEMNLYLDNSSTAM